MAAPFGDGALEHRRRIAQRGRQGFVRRRDRQASRSGAGAGTYNLAVMVHQAIIYRPLPFNAKTLSAIAEDSTQNFILALLFGLIALVLSLVIGIVHPPFARQGRRPQRGRPPSRKA